MNLIILSALSDERDCDRLWKSCPAYQEAEIVNQVVEIGLVPYTAKTIVTAAELKRELDEVRARGYAVDDEEIEIGLPHRFQVDLYETWAVDQDRRVQQDEVSAEVRYALADWGKIPLNPTLYLEYEQHDHNPNTLEGKLLLDTDLSTRWHWG